jgi:hypothetical protein
MGVGVTTNYFVGVGQKSRPPSLGSARAPAHLRVFPVGILAR